MPGYCVAGTVGHKILNGVKRLELDNKQVVSTAGTVVCSLDMHVFKIVWFAYCLCMYATHAIFFGEFLLHAPCYFIEEVLLHGPCYFIGEFLLHAPCCFIGEFLLQACPDITTQVDWA